jgi:UDP-N-acetylmuramate--alanine ligase
MSYNYSHIYFVGIGGIGMSNLARYFKTRGKVVAGYDRTKSELTEALESEGIAVHYTDNVSAIPVEFLKNDFTLVIRTPAVPEDHSELLFFKNNGYKIL